jgi:hypothetical protein
VRTEVAIPGAQRAVEVTLAEVELVGGAEEPQLGVVRRRIGVPEGGLAPRGRHGRWRGGGLGGGGARRAGSPERGPRGRSLPDGQRQRRQRRRGERGARDGRRHADGRTADQGVLARSQDGPDGAARLTDLHAPVIHVDRGLGPLHLHGEPRPPHLDLRRGRGDHEPLAWLPRRDVVRHASTVLRDPRDALRPHRTGHLGVARGRLDEDRCGEDPRDREGRHGAQPEGEEAPPSRSGDREEHLPPDPRTVRARIAVR